MEIWLFYGGIALIYVIFALSLNLLLGFAGQVSVAHAAFGAIGGYTVGYLTLNRDWNFLPALFIGIAIAFVVGTIVALPAMRLSVEYLILLTLAISSVIIGAFTTFPELGGTYGLINLPTAELFGWTLAHPRDWVLPLLVVAAFTYWLTDRLGESPYGRVLRGIREDGQAVQSLGKNVFRFKLSVFAITSALAALAGGLFSAFEHLATPSLFGFSISLTIFAMVILGGMGNLTGSVVGAVVLASLDPVLTRVIGLSADKAFFVQFIVYGLLLVVMMRLRPEGVLPEGFSLVRWARRQQQPIAGRVEMVRTEGWVPNVSTEVAQLARAEQQFLEETATVTAGEPVTGNGDEERARAGLWARAPVVLEVTGLSKRFGGIIAADDLTFTLRQGAIAALVGPNGAGKTTVFNLLTGFIPPDSGSVRLRGVELLGASPDDIARMGMVRSFQDVRLFQRLSNLTNVAMGVPGQPGERVAPLLFRHGAVERFEAEAIEKARGWLSFVGMAEFADIPTGALSYGQTKLVSLARVLATEAEVILLDEPASGIDDVWVDTMLGLIESLRDKGRTICIVEHNLHVVGRLADHTYFMELGRITAEGTIGELTSSDRLAEAYFGTV